MQGLVLEVTDRGLKYVEFPDTSGSMCSLGESSAVQHTAVWLGLNSQQRMHLNQEQVAAILPLLDYFVKTGQLPTNVRRKI